MRRPGFSEGFWPLVALLVLWGAAFAMGCWLSAEALQGTVPGESVAGRVLGVGREALGGSFYDEADNFFHRGVGHVVPRAFADSTYERWGGLIRPSGHLHTEGDSVGEIMPWLRFATRMDPHNVEAHLTTAYWLAAGVRRDDLAEEVLIEAQRNNPDDHRVLSDRALLLFRQRQDDKAAALLDASIRLWPGRQDPEDPQTKLELARALSYRAFLYELKDGDRARALELFRRARALSPHNEGLALRVKALEAGEDFGERDRQVWDNLFARKNVCGREGEAHEHDHDGHDDDEHGEP